MILRKLGHRSARLMTYHPLYKQSRFDKFLFFIRGVLNKMANQQSRSFKDETINKSLNLPEDRHKEQPQTQLQIEKKFLKDQQQLTTHEKTRMTRIDQILGTKTHFHDVKKYQQRISHDTVLQVSYLKEMHPQTSRTEVDLLNPQIPFLQRFKKQRRYKKLISKFKKYPSGNSQLNYFEEKPIMKEDLDNHNTNAALIKFLSQEQLFTRLALSQLRLTMQSIQTQKVEQQLDGQLVDMQYLEQHFVYNGQVYFRPENTMSIYRIDQANFNKKIVNDMDSLTQALVNQTGRIQQVVSIGEIHECLLNYYYDQRVHEYLAKIENNDLNYLFSSFYISPDGRSVFFVIDLLDTKKQFVGMFKQLGSSSQYQEGISPHNVIFNIRSEAALRDDGTAYYIQRSEEGLFIEFTKTKFDTSLYLKTTAVKEKAQEKNVQMGQRSFKVLYKCKPYQELKILHNKEAKVEWNGKFMVSNNILLEETDIGAAENNRIYVITHQKSESQEFNMQLLTANNYKLAELYKNWGLSSQSSWPKASKTIYTECHEIYNVGYLLVRYNFVSDEIGSRLKYGYNQKYAFYVSFVPFSTYQPSKQKQDLIEEEQSQKKLLQGELQQKNEVTKAKENIRQVTIELPLNYSVFCEPQENIQKLKYKLKIQEQKPVYISQQNQYLTHLQVRHSGMSNVYLLISNSVDSVYNRNSLYVKSLQQNVKPYSLYLDGFPIEVISKNIGSGEANKFGLRLHAPLLPVRLEYTPWKKQLKQSLSRRIYTQTVSIKQSQEGDIAIKLISNNKYVNRKFSKKHEAQPVILYLPSQNQRLDDILVQKMLEKGVMFIQIASCRGIFGSTMIELLRGSNKFYENYVDDLYQTLVFIRENISEHIGVYAEGPSSCFATLLLSITENQNNQLFDCSVLHEGIYDTDSIKQNGGIYFGSDPEIFKKVNPYTLPIHDPTKSQQDVQAVSGEFIFNLQNIVFSSLNGKKRAESRKFVNKLRSHRKIVYETVYLKQFDKKSQKDIFNLAFLYQVMKKKLQVEYTSQIKQKYEQIKQKGQSLSRDHKDFLHQTRKQIQKERE